MNGRQIALLSILDKHIVDTCVSGLDSVHLHTFVEKYVGHGQQELRGFDCSVDRR